MTGIGWQDVTVAVLAVLAIAFLVWRRYRKRNPPPTIVTLGRAKRTPPSSR